MDVYKYCIVLYWKGSYALNARAEILLESYSVKGVLYNPLSSWSQAPFRRTIWNAYWLNCKWVIECVKETKDKRGDL